jgi:hypothetical protein
MEDKIKQLILPYLSVKNENNQPHIEETILYIKDCLCAVDIHRIDMFALGIILEEDYLRHVDFALLKGLEQIKQQFNKQS